MKDVQNLGDQNQIEIIKKVYSGLSQNDVTAVLDLMASNITRFEFVDSPAGGIYRGHADLKRNIEQGRSTWDIGTCEPIEFFSEGGKVVVVAHVKVRLKNDLKWIDAITTDGFSLKDGQITEFHSFSTKQLAFEWAGFSSAKLIKQF